MTPALPWMMVTLLITHWQVEKLRLLLATKGGSGGDSSMLQGVIKRMGEQRRAEVTLAHSTECYGALIGVLRCRG